MQRLLVKPYQLALIFENLLLKIRVSSRTIANKDCPPQLALSFLGGSHVKLVKCTPPLLSMGLTCFQHQIRNWDRRTSLLEEKKDFLAFIKGVLFSFTRGGFFFSFGKKRQSKGRRSCWFCLASRLLVPRASRRG